MNKKANILIIMLIVMSLLISCGSPAVTETLVATEAPMTESPTEAPAATEVPATEAPTSEEGAIDNFVAILVVDNFTSVAENKESDGSCVATPDGQGLSGGRGASMTILGQPHGLFVYNDLLRQIDSSGIFTGPTTEGSDFLGTVSFGYPWIVRSDYYLYQGDPNQGLLVLAVDTSGFNTDAIAANIPLAIDLLSHGFSLGEFEISTPAKIVVNMSFVLVPCNPGAVLGIDLPAVQAEYDTKGDFYSSVNSIPALDQLRNRSANLYNIDLLGSLTENLLQFGIDINQTELPPPEDLIDNVTLQAFFVYLLYHDGTSPYPNELNSIYTLDPNNPPIQLWDSQGPLYSTLQTSLATYPNVVYVGAAGNFGYTYPLAPASWDFVISTSSEGSSPLSDCRQNIMDYSNCAEVQLDGVFDGIGEIVGTSFAAPKFSFRVAQQLWSEFIADPTTEVADICPVVMYNTEVWDNLPYAC